MTVDAGPIFESSEIAFDGTEDFAEEWQVPEGGAVYVEKFAAVMTEKGEQTNATNDRKLDVSIGVSPETPAPEPGQKLENSVGAIAGNQMTLGTFSDHNVHPGVIVTSDGDTRWKTVGGYLYSGQKVQVTQHADKEPTDNPPKYRIRVYGRRVL